MHAMLDIETLGTEPESAVLSAGVVFFDPQTGTIHGQRTFVFDVNAQGRKINFETVKWWMNQSQEASAHWRRPDTLSTLAEFVDYCRSHGDITWWANSPAFDMIIMESFMRSQGYTQAQFPWKFYRCKDVRTIKTFLFNKIPANNTNAHDPVADCLAQIELVCRFYAEQAMVGLLQERE